jgi:hypothetical protein
MIRFAFVLLAASLAVAAQAGETAPSPALTAAQIVERNIAARGGLDAWRKIKTMAWVGHIESPNAPGPLSFVLEIKRPNKTRFEIHAQNQKSVRMFDGTHGWKLRAGPDGFPDLQAFTPEETKFAQDGQGIDGPLIDYEDRHVSVALQGMDKIDDAPAYRLAVTLPSGASHRVWVDAKSFLDVASDREARNAFGMTGTVTVHYLDYRTVDGLKLPFLIESSGSGHPGTDKMVIDKIVLNPPLQDWMFTKPEGIQPRNAVWSRANAPQLVKLPGHGGVPLSQLLKRPAPAGPSGSTHAP